MIRTPSKNGHIEACKTSMIDGKNKTKERGRPRLKLNEAINKRKFRIIIGFKFLCSFIKIFN